MKKIMFFSLFFSTVLSFSNTIKEPDDIRLQKEIYKYENFCNPKETKMMVNVSDRYEEDAILETIKDGYIKSNDDGLEIKKMKHQNLMVFIMPKVSLFVENIDEVLKYADNVIVFFMKNDKKDNYYGDRSYETFLSMKVKLRENVIVYSLDNQNLENSNIILSYKQNSLIDKTIYKEIIEPKIKKILIR